MLFLICIFLMFSFVISVIGFRAVMSAQNNKGMNWIIIQNVPGGTDQTSGECSFAQTTYTDITQNTYIQSWTVTEILVREKGGLLWCLRTVLVSVTSFSPLLELHSYVRANVAPSTLETGVAFSSVYWLEVNGQLLLVCECFVVLFNGFISLTRYFDVMYGY